MHRPPSASKIKRMQQRHEQPVAFVRCIQYVLWHLSRQNLSTKEIHAKLERHFGKSWASRLQPPDPGHPLHSELDWQHGPACAFQQWLSQCPYQSDVSRAQAVLRSSASRYGSRVVEQKLVHKLGSDSLTLVAEEVQDLKQSELERLLLLLSSKYRHAPSQGGSNTEYILWKQKISNSFIRKGFSWSTIQKAWQQLESEVNSD